MTRFQRVNLALGMILLAILTAAAVRAQDTSAPLFVAPASGGAPSLSNS